MEKLGGRVRIGTWNGMGSIKGGLGLSYPLTEFRVLGHGQEDGIYYVLAFVYGLVQDPFLYSLLISDKPQISDEATVFWDSRM